MESINLNWQYIPTEEEREKFAKIKKIIDILVKFSILLFAFIALDEANWQYREINKISTYAFGVFYIFILLIWTKFAYPKFVLHDYNITINNLGITIDLMDIGTQTVFEWDKIKSWSEDKTFYQQNNQKGQFAIRSCIKPNELYVGTRTMKSYITLHVAPSIRQQVIKILRDKNIEELKRDKAKPLFPFKFNQ